MQNLLDDGALLEQELHMPAFGPQAPTTRTRPNVYAASNGQFEVRYFVDGEMKRDFYNSRPAAEERAEVLRRTFRGEIDLENEVHPKEWMVLLYEMAASLTQSPEDKSRIRAALAVASLAKAASGFIDGLAVYQAAGAAAHGAVSGLSDEELERRLDEAKSKLKVVK